MAIPQKSANPMAVFSTTTLEKVIMEEVRRQTSLLLESNKQLLNMCTIMADELKSIKGYLQSAKTIQAPVSNPMGEGNAVQKSKEIPGNTASNINTAPTEEKRGRGRPPLNSVNWEVVIVQFGGMEVCTKLKECIFQYCDQSDVDASGKLTEKQLADAFDYVGIPYDVMTCIPKLTRDFFRSAMGSELIKRAAKK